MRSRYFYIFYSLRYSTFYFKNTYIKKCKSDVFFSAFTPYAHCKCINIIKYNALNIYSIHINKIFAGHFHYTCSHFPWALDKIVLVQYATKSNCVYVHMH